MADELKAKLKRIDDELAAAREQRVEARRERDEAREAYAQASDDGPESQAFQNAEAKVEALGQAEERISGLTQQKMGVLKMLGVDEPERRAGDGNGEGMPPRRGEPRGDGWDSSQMFSSDEIRELLRYHATSKSRMGGVDLGTVIGRDALVADVAGSTASRTAPFYAALPELRRKLRILDLIPKGTMDNNVLPYSREEGVWTAPEETAEGAEKPEGTVKWKDATAVAETIAWWMKLQKQSLADVPVLRTLIDSRLRYGVERRLETQIVHGSGEEGNIEGIVGMSGIGVVKYDKPAATSSVAEKILKAITTIFLADSEATGAILTPAMWESALTEKAKLEEKVGSGEYYSQGPFMATPFTMWGLPIIPSASMLADTALVGDFEIGATLLFREGVNVLFSDSDQDDFVKNKVTLLGECRAALPVWRPAAFCAVYGTKTAEEAA